MILTNLRTKLNNFFLNTALYDDKPYILMILICILSLVIHWNNNDTAIVAGVSMSVLAGCGYYCQSFLAGRHIETQNKTVLVLFYLNVINTIFCVLCAGVDFAR